MFLSIAANMSKNYGAEIFFKISFNLRQIFLHHFSKTSSIFSLIHIIKFLKKSSSPLINQSNHINGYLGKRETAAIRSLKSSSV